MKNGIYFLTVLLIGFFSLNFLLQEIEISGLVIDESGQPIIGASVQEKGTTNGTVTDLDGKFELKVT